MTAPAATAPEPLPPAITDLLPAAIDLAIEMAELPPRNRLMTHLKVGAPKAATVRDALARVHWPTANQIMIHVPDASDDTRRIILRAVTGEPDTGSTPGPHLHAVPDPDPVEPDPDPVEPDPDPVEPDSTTGPADAQDRPHVDRADPVPAGTEPVQDATLDPDGPGGVATQQASTDVTETRPVVAVEPATGSVETTRRPVAWPVLLLALPAFVAIWSGWVSLGELSGFGLVHPLPGIADTWTINTAITLPVGMETYAAYAIYVWLSGRAPHAARRFAKWSAIGSLLVGALGQVTYHLMSAAGWTSAPWPITAAVACLPVAVLGMGAALAHLLHAARTA